MTAAQQSTPLNASTAFNTLSTSKLIKFLLPALVQSFVAELPETVKIFLCCLIWVSIPLPQPGYSLFYLASCYKNLKKGVGSGMNEEKLESNGYNSIPDWIGEKKLSIF